MQILDYDSKEEWLNLRMNDVTSTEVSALFGLSPYMTEFELWHNKSNKENILINENERMKWGTRLEEPIARGIAEDQGWEAQEFKKYIRHDKIRAGSSFDFFIKNEEGEGILEIKNVDWLQFQQKWSVDGDTVEAPYHIELQAQHQLLITGKKFLYIGALVGGNETILIRREPDSDIQDMIEIKVNNFWQSVDSGVEPSPDFDKDYEAVIRMNSYAEPGKIINANESIDELVFEYRTLSEFIKDKEKKRKSIKAEILEKIGDAEKVLGADYSITTGMTGPSTYTVERKGFRNFRVNKKRSNR